MSAHESKATFFRQGGWMVLATVAGGVFMTAVHFIAGGMAPNSEYGVFCTLLRIYLLMGIPATGLQTVFAQQAAAALDGREQRQLAANSRAVIYWTFLVWAVSATLVLVFSQAFVTALKISNADALWITLLLGLAALWMPVLKGLLQGRQHFLGMGWVMILDGVGRFTAVVVIVRFLHGQAAGGMLGALLGQVISLAAGLWFARAFLFGPGEPFDWKPWIRRVVPLTFGAGAILILSNADIVFVQSVFSKETTSLYAAGAIVGFALAQFTMPLAVVMYPKIARSAARSETTDALSLTLKATAIMGSAAALVVTGWPELPLRILYFRNPAYFVQAAPLVPWFAWCLLIVSLANVLVSNLLARERFAIVPWLAAIAAGYLGTLIGCRASLLALPPLVAFQRVVMILGAFSLALSLAALWFTWGRKSPPAQGPALKS